MEEITEHEVGTNNRPFVFFYTQMCGTCQLGEKMLSIVEEALQIKISKCNINFISKKTKELQVESVPCLIIWDNAGIVKKIYAFHSVDYLFKELKRYR
jgi:thiol-disulfide isomerase/thioredoxin